MKYRMTQMMLVLLMPLVGALLSLVGGAPAHAEDPPAIAVVKITDLAFGCLRPDLQNDVDVTVTPAGTRSLTGSLLSGLNDLHAAAEFTVIGAPNTAFSMSLPTSATLTSGVNSLSVSDFAANPALPSAVLGVGGWCTVHVGATLCIPARCPPGIYAGSFSLTVSYE